MENWSNIIMCPKCHGLMELEEILTIEGKFRHITCRNCGKSIPEHIGTCEVRKVNDRNYTKSAYIGKMIPSEVKSEIKRLRYLGLSCNKIGDLVGVSAPTVMKHIRKEGLE